MELQVNKMNRQVHFITAPMFDIQDKSGKNNAWLYNRAPDGYLFKLDSVQISVSSEEMVNTGIFAMFDGHEYTHWNIYPGVESRELLGRTETSDYSLESYIDLKGWECKEYSIAVRSTSPQKMYRCIAIVWYYLDKMSLLERLMYACLHPKFMRIKKGGPTTVEADERG